MHWREWAAVGFLLGLAVFMAVAGSLHIPTPIDGLQRVLEPVGREFFEFR